MLADDPGQTRRLGADPSGALGLALGEVVAGWRVDDVIASGGFGTVYLATHVVSGATGALKLLHPHLVATPEVAARLVREAEIIAQLHHPNVVGLLEAGVGEHGAPYLVMEHLRGVDLDTVLRARGRFAPAAALATLEAVCAALATAHAHGVIHRDVKAANVLVCADGDRERVVLIDFGIAKLLEGASAELTASRQALGTPASMAPEQIRGEAVDARTDVYALAALAFHLLTGQMVFADASVTMSQYLHLHAARPRPSEVAPLPAAVDEVITRAMAVDRHRRYADPLAFFAALRAALTTTATPAARVITGAALLVSATHDATTIDDALLDDLDAVPTVAEPLAVAAGLVYLRDLGDAWLYVGDGLTAAAAETARAAITAALAARPTRHPQVTVVVRAQLGAAEVRGGELIGGALADPSGW